MVSEKICLDILHLMLGAQVTMTRTDHPGTDEEKIHKNPVKTDEGWEKKARYTFINDEPVEIK